MSSTKLSRLAAKLEHDTLTEKLAWTTRPVPADLANIHTINSGSVYEATHNGVHLRIFNRWAPRHDKEICTVLSEMSTTIQFLDDNGCVEWEGQNIEGIDQLLDTIKFKLNKIAKKIDAILAA